MSASVGSVEAYVPGRAPFTSGTKPTASQVAMHLADATAEVAGLLLQAGYDVPIPTSATVAVRIVDTVCAKVAAAIVERTAPTKDRENLKAAEQMAEAARSMIRKGELPGVDKNVAQSSPRGGYAGATAYFSRDMAL